MVLVARDGERLERIGKELSDLFRLGLMEADAVANAGFRGLMRGRTVIVPGLRNKLLAFSARLGPRKLVTTIAGWMNEENAGGASR